MKDKVVTLRLTDELNNMLEFKAVSAGMTKSDYLRNFINGSNVSFNDSKDIAKLLAGINKVGNNLNQIAHVLNIANKSDNLNDIDYDIIKDDLLIIKHQMNELLRC